MVFAFDAPGVSAHDEGGQVSAHDEGGQVSAHDEGGHTRVGR